MNGSVDRNNLWMILCVISPSGRSSSDIMDLCCDPLLRVQQITMPDLLNIHLHAADPAVVLCAESLLATLSFHLQFHVLDQAAPFRFDGLLCPTADGRSHLIDQLGQLRGIPQGNRILVGDRGGSTAVFFQT